MKAHYNRDYTLSRRNVLAALGLPDRIPVGQTAEWENVEVVTGYWFDGWPTPRPPHLPRRTIVLPKVRLVERGVANRIQVECPECGRWMRFCGLQQHVWSKTCQAAKIQEVAAKGGAS